MARSPSDINAKNIHLLACDLSGPMVSFSFCQAEGRRSSHVVDVVDFLFLPLSLNWIDFSFLYMKDTLVHIECEAVFRPRMPIFLLGKWKMRRQSRAGVS